MCGEINTAKLRTNLWKAAVGRIAGKRFEIWLTCLESLTEQNIKPQFDKHLVETEHKNEPHYFISAHQMGHYHD